MVLEDQQRSMCNSSGQSRRLCPSVAPAHTVFGRLLVSATLGLKEPA